MKKLITGCLLPIIFLCAEAHAETQYYRVDLIMFNRTPVSNNGNELFKKSLKPIETESAIDIQMPMNPQYRPVNSLLADVQQAATNLTQNPKYDVVYQQAWIQPGLNQLNADAIKITAGQVMDPAWFPEPVSGTDIIEFSALEDSAEAEQPIEPIDAGLEITPTEDAKFEAVLDSLETTEPPSVDWNPTQEIEGTIKIIKERYLHFVANLNIVRLPENFDHFAPELMTSRMKTHRKMRSNEIHYIDHPLLGVILKITPVDAPEQLTEQAESVNESGFITEEELQ